MTFYFGDSPSPGRHAIRGHIVTVTGDPFVNEADAVLVDIEDGLVIVEGGLISAVGPYRELADSIPDGIPFDHYQRGIITSGFIDTHIHYVQTGIIGAFGAQLIDWLNTYTFVAEQRFSDKEYASQVAEKFFDELLRNGTTTALTFCAVYPSSVDAFFEEATRRNMRMAGGKVMMDRNAPEALLDTARSSYDDTKALIAKWHGTGRNLYAVTPRFAPTSTPEQLEAAGRLLQEHPDVLLQTHVSENLGEIAWVKELFPDSAGYLDVYDGYGLLRRGSVFAHGVHLTEPERIRLVETGAAVSHCPTSNLFLGSGLFSVKKAKDREHNMTVGLGTDIGAGTSFSMLQTMDEAYKVAQLSGYPLDSVKMLYLATLGSAQAMGLDDRIGSIEVGKEADLIVLDPDATQLLSFRSAQVTSLDELLFVLAIMGDDWTVAATYIAGDVAYARDGHNH